MTGDICNLNDALIVAFNAVAVYKIEADKGPSDRLAALLERESLALRCVAARRAHTAWELAAKAALLAQADETPVTVELVVSLAEDAAALARAMVDGAP